MPPSAAVGRTVAAAARCRVSGDPTGVRRALVGKFGGVVNSALPRWSRLGSAFPAGERGQGNFRAVAWQSIYCYAEQAAVNHQCQREAWFHAPGQENKGLYMQE